MNIFKISLLLLLLGLPYISHAEEDYIELEVTTIKGNKELPKILYVVPWKDMKNASGKDGEEHKLVLHSLFGDLFDPVVPNIQSE